MAIDLDKFFRESLIPWKFGILEGQDYVDAVLDGSDVTGWNTGIVNLDAKIKLVPREQIVIGARPGTGKTAIGMQIAENVARQIMQSGDNGIVAIFSAEMDSRTLALRTACSLEEIQLWRVQNGEIDRSEGERLKQRLASMLPWPVVVDQSSSPTLEHMVEQMQLYAEDQPIRLMLFDYLELAGEMAQRESNRVAKISRGLSGIAKQFDTPVLVLSQLNRAIEDRVEKRAYLRDLMHGGEREPDRVLIMVRESMYGDRDDNITKVYVAKNRNAPLGETELLFDEKNMRFRSVRIAKHDLNEHLKAAA